MKDMTLMQHFAELRRRVLWTIAIFFIAFVVGWYMAPVIQEFLTMPLMRVWPDGAMLYTGLSDGLMIHLSLATLFAFVFAIPVAMCHAWAFAAPGLTAGERRFIWPIVLMSPVLFVCGAAFAFYVLFPFVFRFFIEMNDSLPVAAVLLPGAREYLSFSIGLLKVFGCAFQMPLIMILMNRAGILTRNAAVRMRRYAIVGIVIFSAIVTPPDVVSQILLALPMIILFQLGILFMRRD